MFKIAAIASGALALAAMSSPAAAQSFSPAPSTTTLSGTLTLQQSQTLQCVVRVNVSIDGSGAATVTSRTFSPGSFLCGFVVQPAGTWTVAAGPGTNQVTLNIGASSILGSCSGSAVVPFAAGQLTFTNVSIPGTPNACTINGVLTSSPTISIVP